MIYCLSPVLRHCDITEGNDDQIGGAWIGSNTVLFLAAYLRMMIMRCHGQSESYCSCVIA